MPFHVLFFSSVFNFSSKRSRYLVFFVVIINGVFFELYLLAGSCFYKAIDFYILTLHPVTLLNLNSLISGFFFFFNSFPSRFFGVFCIFNHVICKQC